MTSCNSLWVPSSIKQNFTNCYSGEYTGLDTLINIQGYYKTFFEMDRYGYNAEYIHKIDSNYTYFLFFNDGIYLGLFSTRGEDYIDLFF